MARKKESKPVPATESALRAVRLELEADVHKQLRIEAAKQDKSMAALVRELVIEYLANRARSK
jgi:plasmid stability protein